MFSLVQLALAFAILSLIAGFFGFSNLKRESAGVAKILFFVFLAAAILSAILLHW